MKYLNLDPSTQGAEDSEDIQEPTELLERRLMHLHTQLSHLPQTAEIQERTQILVTLAETYFKLNQVDEAWEYGRQAFDLSVEAHDWERAIQACQNLFLTEKPQALAALGNGIWLAVTFPVDPELTVLMLEYLVEDTPHDSDGAAVAAATAHYIADLRTTEQQRENLLFFTNQLLAKVARRHSNVETQEGFEAWFKRLELDSPEDFLGRLAQILNVIVQDEWWIDREAIRAQLPIH